MWPSPADAARPGRKLCVPRTKFGTEAGCWSRTEAGRWREQSTGPVRVGCLPPQWFPARLARAPLEHPAYDCKKAEARRLLLGAIVGVAIAGGGFSSRSYSRVLRVSPAQQLMELPAQRDGGRPLAFAPSRRRKHECRGCYEATDEKGYT